MKRFVSGVIDIFITMIIFQVIGMSLLYVLMGSGEFLLVMWEDIEVSVSMRSELLAVLIVMFIHLLVSGVSLLVKGKTLGYKIMGMRVKGDKRDIFPWVVINVVFISVPFLISKGKKCTWYDRKYEVRVIDQINEDVSLETSVQKSNK